MTGSRRGDKAAALAEAKRQGLLQTQPPNTAWHHNEDLGLMQLVNEEVHQAFSHTQGGSRSSRRSREWAMATDWPPFVSEYCPAPAEEPAVARFEAELGVALPPEYRGFLQTHNGGRPIRTVFQIDGKRGAYSDDVLNYLYGMGGVGDQLTVQRAIDLAPEVRADTIPIGSGCFGDRIHLAIRGPDRGAVFWQNHEDPKRKLWKVADNFHEFMWSLTPENIDP